MQTCVRKRRLSLCIYVIIQKFRDVFFLLISRPFRLELSARSEAQLTSNTVSKNEVCSILNSYIDFQTHCRSLTWFVLTVSAMPGHLVVCCCVFEEKQILCLISGSEILVLCHEALFAHSHSHIRQSDMVLESAKRNQELRGLSGRRWIARCILLAPAFQPHWPRQAVWRRVRQGAHKHAPGHVLSVNWCWIALFPLCQWNNDEILKVRAGCHVFWWKKILIMLPNLAGCNSSAWSSTTKENM